MGLDLFGDFGSVGASNPTSASIQDVQATLNYYPEISPSKSAKEVVALLSSPGLIQVAAAPGGGAPGFSTSMTSWPQPSSVTNLPVRALWVLPGQTQALAVIASVCYLVTIVTYGSTNTPGVLALRPVGTLATNSGYVCIRDNGIQGGFAIITDGPNGYLYGIQTSSFSQITDPNFLGANRSAYIDGWWIFNEPSTAAFYTPQAPYSEVFNASYFALKDAFSDALVGVMENKEELWLLGEETSEIWYDAGTQYFPFQRLVGTLLQVGCKAAGSITRLSREGEDGLAWFGRSDRGENIFVASRGLSYQVISTPAVSDQIATYPVTSDCIGYTYQEDTHEFCVWTFPTADVTWVYDASMPIELAWTQRASYDPYSQTLHRHRSNCFMNFAGMRIVGDYQNGALYQMTRAVQNDAGWPLLSRRRGPHIWKKEDRRRAFMSWLQLDFQPGQGAASGLGANPTASLRISRDGGKNFGMPRSRPMGAIGKTLNRCMWRRLGWGRDNVAEFEVIAPVNRDLIGATLRLYGEG